MSLFEGLNVATRGLAAAQLGINVTGQNITNASDPTYSRKRIEQSADWRRDGSFGQMGFGVEVYSINRMRNEFVDRLVNEETTRYGFYGTKSLAYARIESIFNEPSDHALNSLLNDFWNGWAEVSNNPDSAGARETLRSTTQTLVGQFHYLTTQLNDYKNVINDEIESKINRVNAITSSIHHCNAIITASENTVGNKANDTRDQRDALLNELASLVDVDYFEDEQGILSVTTNGHMLVSPARNHELEIRRVNMTNQSGYEYAKVEITFAQTGRTFQPKSGQLKALLDVRDLHIPEYEKYIDDLARNLITEVNKIHQDGYGLSAARDSVGLTFIDFFDSDPSKFNAANIDISQAVKNSINNIAAGLGGKIDSVVKLSYTPQEAMDPGGSPYNPPRSIPLDLNMQSFDPRINPNSSQYVPEFDPNNALYDPGLANAANPPIAGSNDAYRYIQKNTLTIEVVDSTYQPPIARTLQEGKDYTVDYANARIVFTDNATSSILNNPNANPPSQPMQVLISFDYHSNGYAGPGDGENALLISQLRDKAMMTSDTFGKSTQTANQFYSGMLGQLGTMRNKAEAGLDTRTFALQTLKTQQDAVMGVDLDEEMANLIKYQHTYTASARYLTTINSMLDTLLNM